MSCRLEPAAKSIGMQSIRRSTWQYTAQQQCREHGTGCRGISDTCTLNRVRNWLRFGLAASNRDFWYLMRKRTAPKEHTHMHIVVARKCVIFEACEQDWHNSKQQFVAFFVDPAQIPSHNRIPFTIWTTLAAWNWPHMHVLVLAESQAWQHKWEWSDCSSRCMTWQTAEATTSCQNDWLTLKLMKWQSKTAPERASETQ